MYTKLSNPDYNRPLGQIYYDIFADLLDWHPPSLNLLVGGSKLPNTPSWVPDWSVNGRLWLRPEHVYGSIESDKYDKGDELPLQVETKNGLLKVQASIKAGIEHCPGPISIIPDGESHGVTMQQVNFTLPVYH